MSSNTLYPTNLPNNARNVSGTLSPSKDDTVLYCDTSSSSCIINLLTIPNNYWNTNYKLYIVDVSNNASTNNIIINAGTGQTIDNQNNISISTNGGSVCIRVSGNSKYSTIGGSNTIPSLTMPVYNTVYVMKNGNDTTGLVERFDKPFLTINAAMTAALAYFTSRTVTNRVRIVVESGTYVENIVLKEFIDFDLGDSVIEGYITDNNIDFGVISDGFWHCIIYGKATLQKTNAGGTYGQSLIFFNSNNNILVNASLIVSTMDDAIAMIGGYARIYADYIQGKSTIAASHNAINMAVDDASTRCVLEVYNATIDTFSGGRSPAIDFASSVEQTLSLINCIVRTTINNATCSSAISVGRTSGSTLSNLRLYNSTIYASQPISGTTGGGCIYVANNCSINVYYIGSNVGNKPNILVGTGIINTYISTLLIDANLPY